MRLNFSNYCTTVSIEMAASDQTTESASCDPPLAINGFRQDVQQLLRSFEKNSTKLDTFVEVWEEMQFGCVFGGISTDSRGQRELHEFADKCFREALTLCLPPNTDHVRVAGIYLLYCLYISRPLHCHTKIRIHPLTELAMLIPSAENGLLGKNYDYEHCFWELYRQSAFCYTRTGPESGHHTQNSKRWRDDINIKRYHPDVAHLLTGSMVLTVLDKDDQYAWRKRELLKDRDNCYKNGLDPVRIERVSNVAEKSLASRLRNVIATNNAKLEALCKSAAEKDLPGSAERDTDGGTTTANEKEPSETIGQKRRRLIQQQVARRPGTRCQPDSEVSSGISPG